MNGKKISNIDPFLMSVLSSRFQSITREMTNTLLKSGRSGVLNTARDFTCAVATADNRLIHSEEGLPVHVIGIENTSKPMTELFDDLAPGDAFLNNSPYYGNTHHADVTMIVPVFYEEKHVFTTFAKAHQADIGNSQPTTYMPYAKDLYEEGALDFPCVRIQRNYEDIKDLIRMCRMRIRVPDQWYGDYLAQIGACRIGERKIIELLDEYDLETVNAFIEAWFEYGRNRIINEIKKLPGGTWEGSTSHDPVPGVAPEGIPINVKITIDPDEGYITVDLRNNIDCVEGGLNESKTCAINNAITGVLNCLDPTLPHNDGSIGRIKVLIRENCVVGEAKHPTCCSVATTNVADRIINVVQATLSKVQEKMGVAEGSPGQPVAAAVISGKDYRREDRPYINEIYYGLTGGPAAYNTDGWLDYFIPVVAGMMYRDSIELDEQKYPIHIWVNELIPDTEGAGQWRGAPSAITIYGPKKRPMSVAYYTDGHDFPPKGVKGGLPGGPGYAFKIDKDGKVTELRPMDRVIIQPNEKIVSICCGGGGYGDPLERDPEVIKNDVREELISKERAREVYGVILNTKKEYFLVDLEATKELRKKLKDSKIKKKLMLYKHKYPKEIIEYYVKTLISKGGE